jgi:Mpv17 / PMP22 family
MVCSSLKPIVVFMIAAMIIMSFIDAGVVVMSFSWQAAPSCRRRSFAVVNNLHKRWHILSVRGGEERRGDTTQLHNSCSSAVVMVSSSTIAALNTFWKTQPYLAAGITCGIKASAADFVAQKRHFKLRDQEPTAVELKTSDETMDYRRNVAFLLYGAVYQGMAQEFVYNHLYPKWFGFGTSPVIVLTKVLFDLLIQTTLVTLPIAYLTKAVIYRYSFREAMRRYVDDIVRHGLLTKYFFLWGPVQCLTFSIVPEHLRVTFIALVSFFWLIVLSTIASRTPDNTECSLEDGLTCNVDG